MKISILSDLHLGVIKIDFKKIDCDVMILAGDIGIGSSALDFIKFHLNNGVKHILYVMGNHEFYDSRNNMPIVITCEKKIIPDSYNDTLKLWKKLEKEIEGLHILHNKEFVYNNVRFLGTTLWTDFSKNIYMTDLALKKMNDYKYITYKNNYLTPHDVFNFHIEAKKWLTKELSNKEKSEMKTIVISHYMPSYDCILPQYHNDQINFLYASNLNYLMDNYKIDFWIHSHPHMSVNMIYKNTNLICNPRGNCYNRTKNLMFNYDFIIDV